jgi:hypothetical protein
VPFAKGSAVKHSDRKWVKLYRDESGSFGDLSLLARAVGAYLLKCVEDEQGRIYVGDGPDTAQALAAAVLRRRGGDRSDRRMLPGLAKELLDDGYLVRDGRYVVVRKFEERQGHAATEPRTDHDRATTEPRTGHEPATKQEPSPRKNSDQVSRGEERRGEREEKGEGKATGPGKPAPADAPSAGSGPQLTLIPGGKADPPKDPPREQVERVWAAWQAAMRSPHSKLDGKREAAIKRGLRAYGLDDCLRAVEGCARSDFHMGRDPKTAGKKYNGVDLIFRDAEHTEKFLGLAGGPRGGVSATYEDDGDDVDARLLAEADRGRRA